ncbi:MAG: type II secretion system protein [Candidatus Saccharibacteria bacterium]|nr:type II secretion system protein [Candidatus Saccharibacteria bacterium]
MRGGRGFTLIEMIIVIAILAMLVVLGTVAFQGFRANARDKEREADVNAFAAYIESLYPQETASGKKAGSYPPLPSYPPSGNGNLMRDSNFAKDMDELPKGAATFPDAGSTQFRGPRTFSGSNWDFGSAIPGVADLTSNGKPSRFAYVPLKSDGSPCTRGNECRSFTIYYMLETGDKPDITIKTLESRRR